MTVTAEQLAAYADGELDPIEAKLVEASIERLPELRAKLAAHRALKAKLVAHFVAIAERPLPDRLLHSIRRESEGGVIDLARARSGRRERRALPRWSWVAAPALAASIALVVIAPGSRFTGDYAAGELALALDGQLVANQPTSAPVHILLSFRDNGGRYCRAYAAHAATGIACREVDRWRVEKQVAAASRGPSEYDQAGSANEAVMATVQDMAAGPALDAAQELAARRRGWRSK